MFEKKFHFYLSLDYNTGLGNCIIIIIIIILIIIIIIIVIGLYHSKTNIEPFYVVPAKDIIAVKLELGNVNNTNNTTTNTNNTNTNITM